MKRGRNIWYLQKVEKIYFYEEMLGKEEVAEVMRIHPDAKEVKDPPERVVEIFKRYING
jgi:hypothetical protein